MPNRFCNTSLLQVQSGWTLGIPSVRGFPVTVVFGNWTVVFGNSTVVFGNWNGCIRKLERLYSETGTETVVFGNWKGGIRKLRGCIRKLVFGNYTVVFGNWYSETETVVFGNSTVVFGN